MEASATAGVDNANYAASASAFALRWVPTILPGYQIKCMFLAGADTGIGFKVVESLSTALKVEVHNKKWNCKIFIEIDLKLQF